MDLRGALVFAADDRAVAVVSPNAREISAVELSTKQRRVVHTSSSALDLSDGGLLGDLVAFVESRGQSYDDVVWRVMVSDWRRSAPPTMLDEISAPLGGGDTWNPLPAPRTDGTRIVWLRWPRARAGEIVLAMADGRRRTIATSNKAPLFAIDDAGRVAIAAVPGFGGAAEAELFLWDGAALRSIAKKPADKAGPVWFVAGRILWADEFGNVRAIASAELIDPASGARAAVRAPDGCALWGATVRQIFALCRDRLERLDLTDGTWRPFASTNIARVFPHAVLRREPADPTDVWRAVPVP